MSVKIRLGQFT